MAGLSEIAGAGAPATGRVAAGTHPGRSATASLDASDPFATQFASALAGAAPKGDAAPAAESRPAGGIRPNDGTDREPSPAAAGDERQEPVAIDPWFAVLPGPAPAPVRDLGGPAPEATARARTPADEDGDDSTGVESTGALAFDPSAAPVIPIVPAQIEVPAPIAASDDGNPTPVSIADESAPRVPATRQADSLVVAQPETGPAGDVVQAGAESDMMPADDTGDGPSQPALVAATAEASVVLSKPGAANTRAASASTAHPAGGHVAGRERKATDRGDVKTDPAHVRSADVSISLPHQTPRNEQGGPRPVADERPVPVATEAVRPSAGEASTSKEAAPAFDVAGNRPADSADEILTNAAASNAHQPSRESRLPANGREAVSATRSHQPGPMVVPSAAGSPSLSFTEPGGWVAPASKAGATAVPDADTPDRLIQSLRMQFLRGGGDAVLQLRPEHLGSVTVSLKVDQGGVSAHIVAADPAVAEWLQANEGTLRDGLQANGLALDRLVVDRDGDAPDRRERRQPPPRHRFRVPADRQSTFELTI